MTDVLPDLETLEKIMLTSPHSAALGFRVVGAGRRRVTVRAPWKAEMVGEPETQALASGVIASLLDHACGLTASLVGPVRLPAPTLDLRIDTLRAAAPRAAVTAEAYCYRYEAPIAFIRASAWDTDKDEPIATAQAAFALPADRS